MSFVEQRVLVVGASSGIGLATAEAFVAAGAHVTVASRGGPALDDVAEALGATAAALNTLDQQRIEAFFEAEAPFDHIVVSAAATRTGSVSILSLEDAYAAMDSKFWGAYRIARAARINRAGSLTLVSGFLAQRPNPASVLQGAINAALEGLMRGLALERAPLRVNVVSPGLIDTPLHSGIESSARAAFFEQVARRLPAGRIGQASDVASAILFVAANPFATGSVVTVDGGGTIS